MISRSRTAITGETGFADSRAGLALRRSHNWLQLAKFGAVGFSGYVVNLAVYVLLVQVLGVHYLLAAVGSFLALVANLVVLQILVHLGVEKIAAQAIAIVLVTPVNFVGNKLWTFRMR